MRFFLRSSLVAAAALLAPPLPAQAVHWSPGTGGNGHWYRAVSTPAGVDWFSATALTSSAGQHLATCTSAAENAFVYGLIDAPLYWQADPSGENVGPWIGAGLIPGGPNGNNWFWVTAEHFIHSEWAAGEPNGSGDLGGHYSSTAPARASDWGDRDATAQTLGYVIEYEFLMDAIVPGAAGGPNGLFARWGNPGATVHFLASTQVGGVAVPGCGGLVVNLFRPAVIGTAVASGNGTASKTILIPGSLAGRGVYFQAVDKSACRVTNLLYEVL